mmetsp:Transcript_18777/g.57833  ORF Transcript_18777/g.57833 Transcript_18777/m.57833 type:complete len:149 (+) Transcript_18777:383-829(+)
MPRDGRASTSVRRCLVAVLVARTRALTFGVCRGRLCGQKNEAWRLRKEAGKGLETGRCVPAWAPDEEYSTLAERVEASGRDDIFVEAVKCRGACERGPNAIALDENGDEIELEELCLETGKITLFGLRSRERLDDLVAKAAAYEDARR